LIINVEISILKDKYVQTALFSSFELRLEK